MTRTAIYSLQDNTLTEQPAMEKPDYDDYGEMFNVAFDAKLLEYNAHVFSLRTIPCHESARSLWKDGQKVEEGKDYEVRRVCNYSYGVCDEKPVCAECSLVAFPLPVKSEDEEKKLWIEAIEFAVSEMAKDPFTPNGWYDSVKQKYIITKR